MHNYKSNQNLYNITSMSEFLSIVLDIIKFTAPAIIVFVTIYYLSKQFFSNQEKMQNLKSNQDIYQNTQKIRLQAYERLILFCERIDVSNLAQRLAVRDMSATELKQAMLISVQKEYEHNLAQQIYVSEKLWEIITLAKSETFNLINQSAQKLPEDATAFDLLRTISETVVSLKINPADQARRALRSETQLILS